ncbi:hypothetical protein [Streptomyces sp. A012304]|uniref:hypothetical protein n=1 Tax=Streptomyces sp. A012304 TaxID=375446 RepID=UPI0022318B36|nr:hypothetical protein [Streptomyces sp. A012304]GKQ41040.1 hypothetical protein ALMP_75590 [Streptomyces sp. A012304]
MTHQPPMPPPSPGFGPPPPQYAAPGPLPGPAPVPGPVPGAVPVPAPAPGPEFLAVDKNNAVVVDASGVAFEMYGITIDLPWPEIRSVHYKAGPNGRTLMVAVVHLDGRVYECVVGAKPRDVLPTWFAQLAWVLGHYRPTGGF